MPKPEINNPLAGILPPHTALTRNILGPTEWTWTTPAGLWTVTHMSAPFIQPHWTVTGPGGMWAFHDTVTAGEVPQRLLATLRALGAIERATGGPIAAGKPYVVGESAAPSIPSESRSNQ